MAKSIKIIFLYSFCQLISISSFSHYYVKFKGDSIPFQKDSLILSLDEVVTDNLDWEISRDSEIVNKNDLFYGKRKLIISN
jgi:hypothetical protein